MKRLILIGLLALLLLSGCAQKQQQLQYIGADSAKKLAFEAAGVAQSNVESSSTDMKTRNGMDYYQVQFTSGGNSYRYDIEALTGVIIESQTPENQTPNQLVTDADTFQPTPDVSGQYNQTDNQTNNPPVAPAQNNSQGDTMITVEEAKVAALTHAGLTADQVTFAKTGLDWEDGRQIYEIEFYTSDYQEYDYEIDPYTSQVISFDYEAEYFTPPTNTGNNSITAEQAKQIALAQVPGATAKNIREFKTDYDDGRLEYEGKIIYNEMEYEFEIDGYSGSIRSWEAESIYD